MGPWHTGCHRGSRSLSGGRVRCKHRKRQRERQGPGRRGSSALAPVPRNHPPNRLPTSLCGFGFGVVSHTSNTIRVMKPKPYIINIIRCPTVFLSRVFSVILSAHYAFPKLNRVLKPGTCALWCEFSHTAVLEVSRASLSLFLPPILAGDPRDFLSFDRPVRTGSDTSRQRRRESLVEPLCHFLRARRRLLCIAIPVYVAELFFYVISRRHDS